MTETNGDVNDNPTLDGLIRSIQSKVAEGKIKLTKQISKVYKTLTKVEYNRPPKIIFCTEPKVRLLHAFKVIALLNWLSNTFVLHLE